MGSTVATVNEIASAEDRAIVKRTPRGTAGDGETEMVSLDTADVVREVLPQLAVSLFGVEELQNY